MKMNFKRLTAILLSVVMILGIMPTGFAAEPDNGDGGYSVTTEAKPDAARIGDTGYATLQEAFAAAENGQTVILLDDVALEDTLTVTGKVTLDMNGKTVSQTKACTENYNMILNKGDLTITGNGKISFTDTGAGDPNAGWGTYTLRNEGTLTVENGTIENLSAQNQAGQAFAHTALALFHYSGSATINGGTISTPNYRSVRLWKGDMTINGGEFVGQVWVQCVDDAAKLTVNGGSFKPMWNDGSSLFIGNVTTAGKLHQADISVTGGTFATRIGANDAAALNGVITGGVFNAAFDNMLVDEGYAALPTLDGTFVVGSKPTATVNDLGAMTIAAGEYYVYDGSLTTGTEDMPLSFVMQFVAEEDAEDMATSPFADWYADFVITFEGLETDSFDTEGCYLAGYYGSTDSWDGMWVKIPVDGLLNTIDEGVRYPVMLGVGMGQKYDYICSGVEAFSCAMFLPESVLAANPDLKVKLELAVVDSESGDAYAALVNGENIYIASATEYRAEDFTAGLKGTGTEADPYQIATLEDLILFRDSVNAGETKYNAPGVYVALTDDIDMTGADWSVNIGDDCGYTFDGIFDGKGHTIFNLTATETAAKADGYVCTGLFGAICGTAVVKNLTLDTVNIDTGDFVGNNAAAVVGFAYNCTGSVENVTVKNATINAKNVTATGAIVGYDYYGKLTVTGCSVESSTVTGRSYVGGVIGYASSNSNLNGNTVDNVTVTAHGAAAGGVAGIMLATGKAVNNTVKNAVVTAEGENWLNSAAAVVGCITGAITVSGTTVENVTPAALVGSEHQNKPTSPVAKVEAKVGDVYYITLDAAIAAAKGQTITLLNTYVVEAGETVTLDLKGQTVSMVTADDKVTSLILNKGDLTVLDSVGGGKLTYHYTGTNSADAYNTIESAPGSVLTVKGGTIENLSECMIAYAVDGLTNGGSGDVTLNIEGGKLTSKKIAVRIFANSTTNAGYLNISGGEIFGRVILQNASAKANKAALNITGGEFTANGYKTDVLYLGGSNGASADFTASVSGGTFTGEILSSSNTGFITGGTFSHDVTEFCAAGYKAQQNTDGTYGVVEDSACGKAAKIGETYYETLEEAFEAAQAGDTVTLLTDVTLTGKLTVSKNVTIDGAGHSIVANHTAFILETSSDCTFKDITLDTNNKAKGVKIASGNVVFDSVTIPNSNKSDAITVNGTLTFKNYFKAATTYTLIDARSGVVNAEPGTVFDMTSWRANVSPANSDLKSAVDTEGNPFFVAYGSTTYYKTLTSASYSGLTLLDNVELTKDTTLSGTLDLNGKTLTVADGKTVKVSGSLTVTGEGTFGAPVVLTAAAATMTAAEGLNVTTSVDGYTVVYAEGKYSVVEKEEDGLKEFYGSTVTMGNELDLKFYFLKDYVANTGYARIVRSYGDGRSAVTTNIQLSSCKLNNNTYYEIVYKGIAAKEMCDTVTVTVFAEDGTQISVERVESVRSYALRVINHADQPAVAKTLMVDMLNYGTAAQMYKGYNTSDLANGTLTDEQKALGSSTMKACANNYEKSNDNYYGTAFVFGNQLSLKMYVKADAIGANGYVDVTYTNHYKQEKTTRITASTLNRGYYEFPVNEIVVADGRCLLTCKFYTAEGTEVVTVKDSLESYVARGLSTYDWLEAVMNFSDSAYAYLHRDDNINN